MTIIGAARNSAVGAPGGRFHWTGFASAFKKA
jgi:hypothetical protein